MDVSELLLELYGRVPPLAARVIGGIDAGRLVESPTAGSNNIAWLIWHVARVQDHHISELLQTDQIWLEGDWATRFGLEPEPSNIGYGHSAEDVAAVQPDDPAVLVDYLSAVWERTRRALEALTAADLDRIVDRRWDPPVTMGVRLISIADDNLQHVGQAAYLKGVLHP